MATLLDAERAHLGGAESTDGSIRTFFQPHSIAVIGATRDPEQIGFHLFNTLAHCRFAGSIYAVHSGMTTMEGRPCIRSVADLPPGVEMACIAVPATAIQQAVEDCAERGIKALLLFAAGAENLGDEWGRLREHLVEFARARHIRLIGPNGLGLVSTTPRGRFNASLAPLLPPEGRVAMIVESRSLGLALVNSANRRGLGISHFVGLGQRIDVSSNDVLEYMEDDPYTDVVLLSLKTFGNPRRFTRIARRLSRRKTIVALKPASSSGGENIEALFDQSGIVCADNVEELLDLAAAAAHQPLPLGRRVGIITNAGAAADLCVSMCAEHNLSIPECSENTRISLTARLPSEVNPSNPIDLTANATPQHYASAMETMLSAAEVDALVIVHLPIGSAAAGDVSTALTAGLAECRTLHGRRRPIAFCTMLGECTSLGGTRESEVFPVYPFPETAARVFGKLANLALWRAQPLEPIANDPRLPVSTVRARCREKARSASDCRLSTSDAREILLDAGFPIAPGGVAATSAEALILAERLGFPVAMKLAFPQLIHKLEVEAIYLEVADKAEARDAFRRIEQRFHQHHQPSAWPGVLVVPMLASATEVMVRVATDPSFGPLVTLGLAGIEYESLNDYCSRAVPLSQHVASEMIRSLRGYRLLEGYRSHPRADIEAIQNLLLRVSELVENVPEIAELELNPVFVMAPGEGCRIVDARVRVQAPTSSASAAGV